MNTRKKIHLYLEMLTFLGHDVGENIWFLPPKSIFVKKIVLPALVLTIFEVTYLKNCLADFDQTSLWS